LYVDRDARSGAGEALPVALEAVAQR
jgi:hypothetical protein